jgi:ATP-binding cassette subfamily B protein
MPTTPELRLRSSVPGRERWEVDSLKGKQGLAAALEKALRAENGIVLVRANPVTGRVLIQFQAGSKVVCKRLLLTHLRTVVVPGIVIPPSKTGGNALVRLLRGSPVSARQVVALVLSISTQIVATARRVTLISTINIALSAPGSLVTQAPSIGYMTGLLALLVAVESVLDYFRSVAWSRLARDTERQIREPLLRHLQHQDVVFFERQGSGRLMNLVTDDTAKIGRFIETIGDNLVESVMSITWAGGMLLWIAPSLFGLAILPLPFVMLAAYAIGPMVTRKTKISSTASSTYSQHLGNSLAGIIDVKNFTAEDSESARLSALGRDVDETSVRADSASSIQYQAVQGIFGAGFTLAIGYAGALVLSGEVLPDRTLHVLYWFPNLMSSLASLQGVVKQYHSAVRASENIMQIMDSQPTIVSGPLRLPEKPGPCEITFDSVGFAYEPGVDVLKDVSFTVKPGKMLAIVGPTGSGKSTLLRLLLRHYDVDEGSILVNGQDIRQLNLRDLRSTIGVVGQDVYLFQGTVQDNVRYGRPDATDEELGLALRNSGSAAFLPDLPAGSESDVGERGQRLSGGQRQRIAIARALLKDAPVLALDEATSQLDYETEGIVQRSIRTSAEGRTLIVVAHRLSTIRRADEIIVLESGQICERGTHDELIGRSGGLYASLWRLQNGSSDDFLG